MKKIIAVLVLCLFLVGFVTAIGLGYHIGRKAGWRDGVGSAEDYLTIKEMKAFDNGKELGTYMGRLEGDIDTGIVITPLPFIDMDEKFELVGSGFRVVKE